MTQTRPVKIFIAYAREDAPLLEKLRASLNVLERGGLCEIFFDGKISPGERWDARLKAELRAADLILMLLTQDFLNSDYVHAVELPKALEYEREGRTRLAPILMDDCLWEFTPLRDLQLILHDGQPIAMARAFPQAVRQVGRVIEEIQKGWKKAENELLAAEKAAFENQKAVAEAALLAEKQDADRRKAATETARKKGEEDRRRFDEGFEKAKKQIQKGMTAVAADAILSNYPAVYFDKLGKSKAFVGLITHGNAFMPMIHLASEMVKIGSGGTFWMGDYSKQADDPSELPRRQVQVAPFLLQSTVVTKSLWDAVMNVSAYHRKGPEMPKTEITWLETQVFLKKLNEKTGRKYRLPSEAEWELAAREGGKNLLFGNGKDTASASEMNFNTDPDFHENYSLGGENRGKPVAIRTFPPNALGLFEMSGNVCEWCQDVWHDNYKGAPTDSRAWETGGSAGYRVLRGGSFEDGPKHCRTPARHFYKADGEAEIFGFRLAHDAS